MNHYDSIGFTGITDNESLGELVGRVSPHTQNIGDYFVYRDPSGAQLWIGADENNDICALEPYFSGSPQKVWVVSVQPNQEADGTGFAQVWQNGSYAEDGECVDGDYSFILDIPDVAAFPKHTEGTAQTIAVCAFAESAELFADEAAYDASQADEKLRYAVQSFIPIGMFADENAPDGTRPEATAYFTGIVRTAEKRTNSLSGSPFYYCEIDTFGGTWSAVYPAEAFADTPQAGNIINGSYWLTGRLVNAENPEVAPMKKRKFWQKWFGA